MYYSTKPVFKGGKNKQSISEGQRSKKFHVQNPLKKRESFEIYKMEHDKTNVPKTVLQETLRMGTKRNRFYEKKRPTKVLQSKSF